MSTAFHSLSVHGKLLPYAWNALPGRPWHNLRYPPGWGHLMVRLLQAGGGTLNKRYESRSLRHIVQHGDPDRDRFWEIPDIPWKEDLPDDELDLPLDHDTDDLSAAPELSDLDMDETNTALTPVWQDEQPLLHSEHCRFLDSLSVWERRVRPLGDAKLADCNLRGRSRLIPHDVALPLRPCSP